MEMAGVGVVYAEYWKVDGVKMMQGLRRHDLVHDFAQQEARRLKEEKKRAADLIDACRATYDDEGRDDGMNRPRHLLCSARTADGTHSILRPALGTA